MNIELSEHFTYRKLLRFTFPSMVMMVLTSVYGVVDGFFISNFIGAEPFAAVNIIMPFLMIFGAVGFMIGTGGSALVAFTLGTGDKKKANEIFSLLVYLLIGLGILFTVIGEIFVEPISRLLGADAAMLPYCVTYGRILMLALIPFMLQNVFQKFSCHSRASAAGTLYDIGFRSIQHYSGCPVYCSFPMGCCRSRISNGNQPDGWWYCTAGIFYRFQKKQTSSGKNTYGSSGNNKSMYQRIFRIYDKRISLHCKYAV